MKYLLIIALSTLLLHTSAAQSTADVIVEKGNPNAYQTIQEAVDASPDNVHQTILVKPGVYAEKVFIGSHGKTSAKRISLIGENPETCIITWDDYNGKTIQYEGKTVTSGTPQSATFTVNAPDFYAANLTFQNTNTTKQAVALYNVADRQTFKNCRIVGYQDTHYLKKGRRSYFQECYIEGATDYICGGGTALFERCTLRSIKNGSYITAPEDITAFTVVGSIKYYYGFIFRGCTLISDPGVEVFLARPWQPTASSIYLSCTMSNIKQAGWSAWSGNTNHLSAFFAEYNSQTDSGQPIDTSNRIDWSVQLSKEQVDAYYSNEQIYSFSSPAYNPLAVIAENEAPLSLSNSTVLQKPYCKNKQLYLPENQIVRLFSPSGALLKTTHGEQTINLVPFAIGTYIVQITQHSRQYATILTLD